MDKAPKVAKSELTLKLEKTVKQKDLDELLADPTVQGAPSKFKDDIPLLKKIIFCRGTLKERVTMFDDLVKWHQSYKPEEIKESEIQTTLSKGTFCINGKDKLRRPIMLFFGALHDPETRDLQETVRAMIYWVEKGIAMMEPGVDQFVMIYDRTDVTSKHFDLQIVKEWATIQNYYPLRLGKAYILHPNWMFNASFKICSVFLSEETLSKIELCNEKTWKQDLAQSISPDNLLETHGGTMKVPYEHVAALMKTNKLTNSQFNREKLILQAQSSGETTTAEDLFIEQLKSWRASLEKDKSPEADMLRKAIDNLQIDKKESDASGSGSKKKKK